MDVTGRLARLTTGSQSIRSPIRRYGFSVLSVAIALGLALVSQYYDFRDGEAPLFNLAVAVTAW
jgi:hypothetical protein